MLNYKLYMFIILIRRKIMFIKIIILNFILVSPMYFTYIVNTYNIATPR